MTSRSPGARLRVVVVVPMVAAALAFAPAVAAKTPPFRPAQTLTQNCSPRSNSHPLSGGFRAGQWVTQGCSRSGNLHPLSGGFRAGRWVP